MNVVVCTICDVNFSKGAGALINSLIRFGYRGSIIIWYIGPAPKWIDQSVLLRSYGIELEFISIKFSGIPNYIKPKIIIDTFERSDASMVFYFDSDIMVDQEWEFFEKWGSQGVALAADVVYDRMSCNHPIRAYWRDLLNEFHLNERNIDMYVNSGFIGVEKRNLELIRIWDKLIYYYAEKRGGFDIRPKKEPGYGTIDQDLLNAALMGCDIPLSIVGREGMTFHGGRGYMLHSIGARKPWKRGFIRDLLVNGRRVPRTARAYWAYADGPLILESRISRLLARLEMDVTAALSRFYHA